MTNSGNTIKDKEPVSIAVDGKRITRYVTNWTTIRIKKQTRDRLEALMQDDKGEAYDAVISRILDKNDRNKK